MPLHDSVDGRLLDDRSPSTTNHLNDPNGEKMGVEVPPFQLTFPRNTGNTERNPS